MSVPRQFQIKHPAPEADRACKVCDVSLKLHTGAVCALCSQAVEHHDTGRTGEKLPEFAVCLFHRKRLASARKRAGVELNEFDRLALDARPIP